MNFSKLFVAAHEIISGAYGKIRSYCSCINQFLKIHRNFENFIFLNCLCLCSKLFFATHGVYIPDAHGKIESYLLLHM